MLEKAYAKFVGSYERLSRGGSSSEAMRAILGYPTFQYELTEATDAFLLIKTALSQGDVVTASTNFKKRSAQQITQNIQTHQIYSVIGTVELKGSGDKVTDKLIYIRNPWAEEHYQGPHVEPLTLSDDQKA